MIILDDWSTGITNHEIAVVLLLDLSKASILLGTLKSQFLFFNTKLFFPDIDLDF